jgi:hypothetical protein
MSEEKAKKQGHSVALSGVIGFILVALLVGMVLGGYLSLFVIAPYVQKMQHGTDNNGNIGNQSGNINPPPTGDQNNNNNNQNGNSSQGINNNNPPITNPTGQYSSIGCQFNLNIPGKGVQNTGMILANVNCVVQQNGNNIQLALTITPTSIPENLNQIIGNSPVTFNFLGTISGSQINANAAGTMGSGNGSTFDFNLSGTSISNNLTLTITSVGDSQLSVSTPQPIILQLS